jgi:hypothetical protein
MQESKILRSVSVAHLEARHLEMRRFVGCPGLSLEDAHCVRDAMGGEQLGLMSV